MSLKFLVSFVILFLLACPLNAKETNIRSRPDFSLGCPTEDALCTGLTTVPKAGPKLEILKFERVIDGDTIVASKRKIRIWGIDTPERDHPGYLAASWWSTPILESRI